MRRPTTLVLAVAVSSLIGGCKGATDPGPGAPTGIIIASGNNQEAAAGTRLAQPIMVRVTDAKGHGVPNQGVEFDITSGYGGQLTAVSTVTNDQGVAGATWTLGWSIAEQQRVRVTRINASTGLPADSVIFRAIAHAGAAARIVAYQGDGQSGFELQRLSDSLVAVTTDAYGNVVPNVPVTFTVLSGGGSVSPTATTSGATGRAAAAFTLGAFGQSQSVRASAAGWSAVFTAYARRQPEGTSISLSGRPYALAVSTHDVTYVGLVDGGALARFDGSSTTRTGTVTVGSTPTELAFNASGTKAFVTNQFSNSVGVIDVATNVQTETIPVTGNPFQVIVSPDASRIYVTTNADYVYAIDLATRTVVGALATGATANGLAISADGTKLYVSTRAGGSVMEVNTATMTTLRTFTPGGTTQGVILSPDGSEMYVVNEQGTLYAYNLGTGALAWTLYLNGSGFGVALSPDGTKLYVTVMSSGTVQVVNRATHAISRSYFVEGTPRRIGTTSDGTVIVANEQGYVTWLH